MEKIKEREKANNVILINYFYFLPNIFLNIG